MSIKNSTIDTNLQSKETFKFEAQTNCKSKEWSSFLYVIVVASVIKRKEFSHFSDCGNEMQRVLKNQVISPRAECLSEVPHFVRLIKFYTQSSKRKRAFQHMHIETKKK